MAHAVVVLLAGLPAGTPAACRSPARYLRERLRRLLVPLLVGILVAGGLHRFICTKLQEHGIEPELPCKFYPHLFLMESAESVLLSGPSGFCFICWLDLAPLLRCCLWLAAMIRSHGRLSPS